MAVPGQVNIIKLKEGDRREFEKTYTEYVGLLYGLCSHYTKDIKISEEIVQDSFLKLWEIKKSLQSDTNIKNFLYTITKNNCLNHLRNQKTAAKHLKLLQEMEYFYAIESLKHLGSNVFEYEELREKTIKAVENLPDNLRQVFKMNRFDELKYHEIAKRLDISLKTVELRISKALKILRNELKEYLPLLIYAAFL